VLIPDNIHPEQTIYFNGAFVLKAVLKAHGGNLLDLYMDTVAERKMSVPVFMLCLDWLFLLNLIVLTKDSKVEICS